MHLGVKQIRVYETNRLRNGKEPIQHLCNVPKFSDTGNFTGIHLKFKNRGQISGYFVKKTKQKKQQPNFRIFCKRRKKKDANGRANSADPDQTAPRPSLGAV